MYTSIVHGRFIEIYTFKALGKVVEPVDHFDCPCGTPKSHGHLAWLQASGESGPSTESALESLTTMTFYPRVPAEWRHAWDTAPSWTPTAKQRSSVTPDRQGAQPLLSDQQGCDILKKECIEGHPCLPSELLEANVTDEIYRMHSAARTVRPEHDYPAHVIATWRTEPTPPPPVLPLPSEIKYCRRRKPNHVDAKKGRSVLVAGAMPPHLCGPVQTTWATTALPSRSPSTGLKRFSSSPAPSAPTSTKRSSQNASDAGDGHQKSETGGHPHTGPDRVPGESRVHSHGSRRAIRSEALPSPPRQVRPVRRRPTRTTIPLGK